MVHERFKAVQQRDLFLMACRLLQRSRKHSKNGSCCSCLAMFPCMPICTLLSTLFFAMLHEVHMQAYLAWALSTVCAAQGKLRSCGPRACSSSGTLRLSWRLCSELLWRFCNEHIWIGACLRHEPMGLPALAVGRRVARPEVNPLIAHFKDKLLYDSAIFQQGVVVVVADLIQSVLQPLRLGI